MPVLDRDQYFGGTPESCLAYSSSDLGNQINRGRPLTRTSPDGAVRSRPHSLDHNYNWRPTTAMDPTSSLLNNVRARPHSIGPGPAIQRTKSGLASYLRLNLPDCGHKSLPINHLKSHPPYCGHNDLRGSCPLSQTADCGHSSGSSPGRNYQPRSARDHPENGVSRTPQSRKLVSRSHSLSTAEAVLRNYDRHTNRRPAHFRTYSGHKLFDFDDLLRHTSLSLSDVQLDDNGLLPLLGAHVTDVNHVARRPKDIDLSGMRYRKWWSGAPPGDKHCVDMELLEEIYWAQMKIAKVGLTRDDSTPSGAYFSPGSSC